MLDNPEKDLKFIHVAGTNGKGSTCAYISQILIEAGYITGQFCSPYIYEFSERIRINNKNISDDDLREVCLKVKEQADKFPENDHPTEFELMTAIAFLYFKINKCQFVVCEVGMGGRLDSTNVIPANQTVLSIITQIDKDHTQFLGDSISKIAAEKAGIIKSGVDVLCAKQNEDAKNVISQKAKEMSSKLYFPDYDNLDIHPVNLYNENLARTFSYKNFKNLTTNLLALYQPYNATLAIEAANILNASTCKISNDDIKNGIKNCYWPARFEIKHKNPYIVIDGAHNLNGVSALIDSLLDVFENKKFIFIMGVLADKDYLSMIGEIAAHAKQVYTITPPNDRNLDAQILAKCFKKINCPLLMLIFLKLLISL